MRTTSQQFPERNPTFPSFYSSFLPNLHRFILENETASAEILIDISGSETLNEQEPRYGNTPLHLAAAFGRRKIVEKLIEAGVNLRIENNHEMTPLDYAKKCNQPKIAEIIQKHLPQ